MTLFKSGPGRALLFSVTLMAGVVAPAFVSAGSGNDVATRINVLEFQTQNLSDSLNALNSEFGMPALVPPQNVGTQSNLLVAQNRSSAATNLRLSQLEEQMRVLNGQVEGLQFQMTQMQTLIERMAEDNEFRFSQLEGGGSGKTDAVTQSGGDRPVGELPQQQNSQPHVEEEIIIPDHPGPAGGALELGEKELQPEIIPDGDVEPEEGVTPLVFEGGERISFEAPPSRFGDGAALNLDISSGGIISEGDADAQYKAGLDAVLQGDYVFAENQFRQFVGLFPEHELAPEATNWFGEALLQQNRFDEAAQVLFDGFERYQGTTRGPDLLLKLGIALSGAGEKDTACRTFGEVLRRYPAMEGAFELRVAAEMARAQC